MRNGKRYLGDSHKAKIKWAKKDKEEQLKKKSNFQNAKEFWDNEYKTSDNFSLSDEPSEDLLKFVRYLERQYPGQNPINSQTKFVDAGCGNGRNAIYLAENFLAKGVAYDISGEAIRQAEDKFKKIKKNFPPEISQKMDIAFSVQNLSDSIPAESNTIDIVVDAVASHVLRKEERIIFRNEVLRVLSSGSYYFLKSLLLDDDSHAKQMVREYGQNAGEENSYIHPTMGIFEHVPSEDELVKFYEEDFYIDKIERSFAHRVKGRANKRRYIVMYLRKK